MRARSSGEAAQDRLHAALHAPSRWGERLKTCVVQTQGGWACAQQSRQHTLPEEDDVRPNTAEKTLEHPL